MSAENIATAVGSLTTELQSINASIGAADSSLADAYRALVHLVDEHASAFVDEVGKLLPGVLENIERIAPNVSRSTFSSAWSAWRANPEEFAKATAVRRFAEIVRESKHGEADSTPLAKALRQLSSALERAVRAGAKAETIADLVRANFPKPKAAEPAKAGEHGADAPATPKVKAAA